jgi:cysteine desulfurase / selenocysteine lyase
MNVATVRKDFPLLSKVNYLNSGASGPLLTPVWDAVDGCWTHWKNGEHFELPDTRSEVGKLIHCDRKNVALVHRASQGINIVSDLVKPKREQNVVLTDLGYPSSVYPWLKYREDGVEIRQIHNKGGKITLRDYEKNIDDNTSIVCLNRVEWSSGLRNDVKAITKVAHDHGALVLDDAFQAVGAVDVDAAGDDVDFLVFGAEKWMCCLARAAALYAADNIIEGYEPSYRFYWRTYEDFTWDRAPWDKPKHDNIASWDRPTVATAEKYDPGCVGEDAQVGFHASLNYFNKLGINEIEKRVLSLSGYLMDELKAIGATIFTPTEASSRAGIVTYSLGDYRLNQRSYDTLQKAGIVISHRYIGGIGGIRVSPHFFNTEEDIDKLLAVQKKTNKK